MHLLEQGTGSFKSAKRIKMRYFWLKNLIDEGEIVLNEVHPFGGASRRPLDQGDQ